ncbi:MAG: peptidoglycan-binding protein [Variovorax sp.]|nr:MAG: peptidoglycan-binding protein [Variovorax sp.]
MSDPRASVGPIPPKAVYICWVQRSLARHGWGDSTVDGADSPRYRENVKAFQGANMLASHGQVDEATQNRLIQLNHVDADYTTWVQAALVKAGLLKAGVHRTEPIMDRPGSMTRQAIRRFQQQRFDRDRSLKPDGWVGSKSELALMAFSATAPPDDTGEPAPCRPAKPKPPGEEPLVDKLRRARLDSLTQDPRMRDRLECLKAFLLEALTGARMDDRYWTFKVFDGWGRQRDCRYRGVIDGLTRIEKPQNAVANFRRMCASAHSDEDVAACVRTLHNAVICHLNALLGWTFHQATLGDARLIEFPECAWVLELHAASQRRSPRSIYACFAALIGPASRHCLP